LCKELEEFATESLVVDTTEFEVPQLRNEGLVVQPFKCAVETYALRLLALDDRQGDGFDVCAVLEDRWECGTRKLRCAVESNDL
jgi:hypothetical protein